MTPIFSGSYSGLFKTFFDVLEPGVLAGKPVLIGATGGTARHSLALDYALRPLFSYLRTVVVPTAVFAAPEDWGSDAQLSDRVDRAAGELADLDPSADGPARHPSSRPRRRSTTSWCPSNGCWRATVASDRDSTRRVRTTLTSGRERSDGLRLDRRESEHASPFANESGRRSRWSAANSE